MHRSRNTIILILGLLMTISPFAIDMYLPAFLQIADEMHSTASSVSMSVASYFIGLAFGQLIYGPLLDRYGRKKPIYAGLSLFMVASIGCMKSDVVSALVAFRLIQALGGCVAWVGAMTMVRDFFPAREASKIFSLLVLVLGMSPLVAPTAGGFITVALGWRAIFMVLMIIAGIVLTVVILFLPEGREPDYQVKIRPVPMFMTFVQIGKQPQFLTYALSGSLGFASLFIYVSGSPVIFMEIYKMEPSNYGILFAAISVGFIGSSQLNILLTRYFTPYIIYQWALRGQLLVLLSFLLISYYGASLWVSIVLIFLAMACIGMMNPNASSLALAPFSRNIGSAAALSGFIQITIASIVSAIVGTFSSGSLIPFTTLMAFTCLLSNAVLVIGRRRIGIPVLGEAGHETIH
jgi:DHA1 family bicyclomycin/chloramphenicol resistance-like MFS transporter